MVELSLVLPGAGVAGQPVCSAAANSAAQAIVFNLPDCAGLHNLKQIELSVDERVTAQILTYGATLCALKVPDRDGKIGDIVLGFDDPLAYVTDRHYFGSTVGRYANRIADGRFDIDGRSYQLARNDGAHHLHGGHAGFDQANWAITDVQDGNTAAVTLALISPAGAEGYPGELSVQVTYRLDRGGLTIAYQATTSAPTIVNLTNHSFFNLNGTAAGRSAMGHDLTLFAAEYLPVDAGLIPLGRRAPTLQTAFDFCKPKPISRDFASNDEQLRIAHGYDHNFIVDGLSGTLRPAARLVDYHSGRVLDLLQTAPGLQFYSGNFLDGTVRGKHDQVYRRGHGIALEPQGFPNAPNVPDFPSVRLNPGDLYRSEICYRFSTIAKCAYD